MSLWWWPGLALVAVALVASLSGVGWWIAGPLVAGALLIEFVSSGREPAALLLPLALLLLSAILITLADLANHLI